MVKPPLRTKSIGFKVSEEEYARLETASQADGRAGGPLKPAFGLSGRFARHRTGLVNDLDCLHALGTKTLSPQCAKSFHHLLLLPPPAVAHDRCRLRDLRAGIGTSASQLPAPGLWLCGHARTCPSLAERARPRNAGGCGEVVEARKFTATDRRGGALLAKALL